MLEQQLTIQKGTFANLQELLVNAQPRLLTYARKYSLSQDSVDDIVQETMLEAWRHIEQLHSPERFDSWLTGICHNVCMRWNHVYHLQNRRLVRPDYFAGIAGILILVYSRLTAFTPALIVFFFVGVTATAGDAILGPLLLHITPHELVGRVISVFAPSTSLASMISIGLAGYLTSTILHNFHATLLGFTFGPIDTIFTVTGLLVMLGALYAMLNLRNIYKTNENPHSIQEKPALESLE